MLLLLPLSVSSELSYVGPIEWSSCPAITQDVLRSSSPELARNNPWHWDPFPHFPAGVGVAEPQALFDAKCAQVSVPLNWMNTSSGNISIFLKKALASKQPALGDIWLLQGGPGGSGMAMEALAARLLMSTGGLQIPSVQYDKVDRAENNGEWRKVLDEGLRKKDIDELKKLKD